MRERWYALAEQSKWPSKKPGHCFETYTAGLDTLNIGLYQLSQKPVALSDFEGAQFRCVFCFSSQASWPALKNTIRLWTKVQTETGVSMHWGWSDPYLLQSLLTHVNPDQRELLLPGISDIEVIAS
ncbi:MAG: hypothetical protein R3194_04335 [Limnobacter sp.]|nr:hypothetical protein [Limnobacter sp.]